MAIDYGFYTMRQILEEVLSEYRSLDGGLKPEDIERWTDSECRPDATLLLRDLKVLKDRLDNPKPKTKKRRRSAGKTKGDAASVVKRLTTNSLF